MSPDDPVCLCFHVTRRKVEAYLRVEKPRRASQLSECGGAGTGCGWCVPYLNRLFERGADGVAIDADKYAKARQGYIDRGKVREAESDA